MSYDYATERPGLFTEEGQEMFIKIRDKVKSLLKTSGAFRGVEAFGGVCGDNWAQQACLDRMIEMGEIVCVRSECWTQYRVYATKEVHGR